ncbi:MAG: 4-hydroxyphenylacetate 3-hydroxylase family protein [Dehalococcoidia bacterium]|jgi:4-hydroxybutyryl-CoA dehydratase/vinylacetyl-CoA-Delta-isomerase|nr:4-hydroxyphenylacetate 3-hydroxylase family protein [Chloroflexota bacterium]MCK4242561.1 4-hydroxyphenylacetate 3-hydroxylase family protein [Dehalococcoidia bacterium]
MGLKTKEDYFDSLRRLNLRLFMFGERIENIVDHPIVKPSANSVAATYELAQLPEHEDLLIASSHLAGERINRFTHIHHSRDDLIKKIKMLRLLGQKTATCFQRCAGMDALNTVSAVTFEIDREFGTDYHQRFNAFLSYVQKEDLVCSAAMTDPRGDRRLTPSQQKDPDSYLRVVDETANGIVIRGAKLHITGALNSHEIIVLPTRAMRPEDRDYAVACAIPSDSKGVSYIYGRQSCDTRKLEGGEIDVGNPDFGGQEALIVFDDVFVPRERVFMMGEHQFCSRVVEVFGAYHRSSYGGCKSGLGDVLIGAAALIADYQGTSQAAHIRDKLVEMTHLNETLYACGIACSAEGSELPSGGYLVDRLLANVCKLHVGRFPFEMVRLAQDIAGGLVVTLPSEKDYKHPELGQLLQKYLQGVPEIATEARVHILRLMENMTLGTGAVGYLTESLHGAGSPQAQRIMIEREANLEHKKQLARDIARVEQ